MKCQIQVRGRWRGTAGDWRPVLAADGTASTFASWDEAEEILDRMQLAGLLPRIDFEASAHEGSEHQAGELQGKVELRIIDLDDKRSSRNRAA